MSDPPLLISHYWLELALVGGLTSDDGATRGASISDCPREFQGYEGLYGRAACEKEVMSRSLGQREHGFSFVYSSFSCHSFPSMAMANMTNGI